MVITRSRKPRCLITGGAGFLGRHLVDALLDVYEVSTFDVHESGQPGVKAILGDIRELTDVEEACTGMDVVFHCATVAPSAEDASNRALAHAVNVRGTQNVIQACQSCSVPKLVFTSSASVVFGGKDLNNVDESAPYAERPLDYYTQTKVGTLIVKRPLVHSATNPTMIEAEKLVLAANGKGALATLALRPSGIFGEWDRLFVPMLVEKSKQGKMKFIIGSGRNLMEFTYVGNVADAHVLAAEKLSLGSPVAGKAFFVTNNQPVPFWGFLGDLLQGLGHPRPRFRIPWQPLFLLALFLEGLLRLLKPLVELKPSEFSSSRIRLVSSNRAISCGRAQRELGYWPRVSLQEGLERTVAHFRALALGHEYKKVR